MSCFFTGSVQICMQTGTDQVKNLVTVKPVVHIFCLHYVSADLG